MGRETKFVIGVDFGTDSVRAVIVNALSGAEISSGVSHYTRWAEGLFCDPKANQFRQHPSDYVESMATAIKTSIEEAGKDVVEHIVAISVDTTGSTPVAVDKHGTPLALLPEFKDNPNAMFVLWKDHTATEEAAEINRHATQFDINYLQFVGGIYSSEWFWAKLLHILRADHELAKACYSFVEHCDWIPFLLTGGDDVSKMKRGVCSAGHKALWSEDFGGLPPEAFFNSLDPLLKGFTSRLFDRTYTADQAAGNLSEEWAQRLGLSIDVLVGVGAFDAHMGAVGGQIEPYHLSKVMGTSTCDMLVAPVEEIQGKLIHGICGQVNGSVIPGMMGLEAGQSAFGDTYAWFRKIISWPLDHLLMTSKLIDPATAEKLREEMMQRIIPELSRQAALLPVDQDNALAIDWLNGRRTPDANQLLKAAVTGLDLGTGTVQLFNAFAEATCFGAKAIVERFRSEGVPVRGLIGLGGVAKKSPYIMQMLANVINMPIRIHKSEQTCAVGAAMFAATVAGLYENVTEAMHAMGAGFDAIYEPQAERVGIYQMRYQQYLTFGKMLEQQMIHGNE